jgi:hypothetical protein
MSQLNPQNLQVKFAEGTTPDGPVTTRAYTLTHSDSTGDLFLTVGLQYDHRQISGWYTRLMRDEVLAEWQFEDKSELHVHCHVSGGLVLGSAGWRDSIFRRHLPMVLETFRYGDQALFEAFPELNRASVKVHFHATQARYDRIEAWGKPGDYNISKDSLVYKPNEKRAQIWLNSRTKE